MARREGASAASRNVERVDRLWRGDPGVELGERAAKRRRERVGVRAANEEVHVLDRKLPRRKVIGRRRRLIQAEEVHVGGDADDLEARRHPFSPPGGRVSGFDQPAERPAVWEVCPDESLVHDCDGRMSEIVGGGEVPSGDERDADRAEVVLADRPKPRGDGSPPAAGESPPDHSPSADPVRFERMVVRERSGFDLGERPDAGEQRVVKAGDVGRRAVTGAGHAEVGHRGLEGAKARVDVGEGEEAARQKDRSRGEQDGDRGLAEHEEAERAAAGRRGGRAPAELRETPRTARPRGPEGGNEPRGDARRGGDGDGKEEDAPVQADVREAGHFAGHEGHQDRERPDREEHSQRAGRRGDEQGLEQDLRRHPAAARAQRGAQCELSPASLGAGELEARDVRAADREEEIPRHRRGSRARAASRPRSLPRAARDARRRRGSRNRPRGGAGRAPTSPAGQPPSGCRRGDGRSTPRT